MKKIIAAFRRKNATYLYCTGIIIILSFLVFRNQAVQNKDNQVIASSADYLNDTGIVKVVHLAEAFKTTLKEEQVSLLQLAYSKTNAARWSNFPQAFSRPNRPGLNLGALTSTQLAAFKALMACVLAQQPLNEGYDEMEGIFAADDYFGKTTGKTDVFGSANYYVAFLGKPSTTALWELQFGGHHFAFANTYDKGKITGVTPDFRGVEPMAPVHINNRTYQPMEQEREAFAGMIVSLTEAEKSSARLSATFSDLLLGPGKDGVFPQTKQGIKIGSLESPQQQLVIKAIELYVNDLDAATAKSWMQKYQAELPDTYLSYSGSGTMNVLNDYVRIDGPDIWMEYSVQPSRDFPGTTHPHSVWRDRKGDYGGN